MCELGRGGVSLTSMAERTLGRGGTAAAGAAYVFLHYALLVAYLSRAGDIIGGELGVPPAVSTVGFMAALTSLTYFPSASRLDQVNAVLVAGVVVSTGYGGNIVAVGLSAFEPRRRRAPPAAGSAM